MSCPSDVSHATLTKIRYQGNWMEKHSRALCLVLEDKTLFRSLTPPPPPFSFSEVSKNQEEIMANIIWLEKLSHSKQKMRTEKKLYTVNSNTPEALVDRARR